MELLWITVLLFLVTGVIPGQTTDEDPEMWLIDRIDRTDKGSTKAQTSDKFKFTLKNPKNSTDATTILLEMYAKELTEGPVSATDTSIPNAPIFEVDLTNYFGSDTNFLVTAKDGSGADLAYATANLPFPNFPKSTTTQNFYDPRDTTEKRKILLRVDGSLGDMRPKTGKPLIIGDINYFAFDDKDSIDYVPCKNSNGVEVCDKELDPSNPVGEIDDSIVKTAVLAYSLDGSAIIKLTVSDTVKDLEAILIPLTPKQIQSSALNILCTLEQVIKEKCNIVSWAPRFTTLQQIIITRTKNDTKPWLTTRFIIKERKLAATQLGADIIEGRWLMLEGEYSGDGTVKSIYRLRKTKTGTNPLEVEDIEVDCSHLALESKLCFGYFPHLHKDQTYTLTVAYKGSDTVNEKDQTESSPVTIKPPESEMEILSRHTTTYQNQQKADVQICFQHLTPTEGRSFSHYEMLIINEKGQWLKHSIMQEEEEEEESHEEKLCFAPFTINTKDFDLTEGTKVIISQRGVDGVSVLASGESALF